MPMAGKGSRFFNDGFIVPKPLIKLNKKPFLYWSARSVEKFIPVADITFVILKDHAEQYHIDQAIHQYFPDARIVIIPEVLEGAVLTCMKGAETIGDDSPLLFNDCDHMFISSSFNQYCIDGDFASPDGALLTFESTEPKYSFLEYDEHGNIFRTVEKQPVSSHAICGAYYFKNKESFFHSSQQYLKECCYQEYFMSGVYNIMAREGRIVTSFQTDIHIPFGTPEEYYAASNDERLRMVE